MSDEPVGIASLGAFIKEEMVRREMSLREFAAFVNVTHPTISRIVDKNASPTLEFLVKLSRSTHTDIRFLVSLAVPDAVYGQDVDAIVLTQRINRLSNKQKQLLDLVISGLVLKHGDKTP